VLAKGAPVDLAPAAFGVGDFRRTRLGQVAAAFWMPAPDTFELMCFRSVAGYVADWLANAARPGSLAGYFA
jgi:sarcosine oxidase subunit gamma